MAAEPQSEQDCCCEWGKRFDERESRRISQLNDVESEIIVSAVEQSEQHIQRKQSRLCSGELHDAANIPRSALGPDRRGCSKNKFHNLDNADCLRATSSEMALECEKLLTELGLYSFPFSREYLASSPREACDAMRAAAAPRDEAL